MVTTLTHDEIIALRLKRNRIISDASFGGIELGVTDFYLSGGNLVIDGMDADEWLAAMGME
jgi:hypothetical protein